MRRTESWTIGAMPNRLPSRMDRWRSSLWVIALCIVSVSLQWGCLAASSGQSGSVKAELFHREHPFSRQYSADPNKGYAERLQNANERSAERVKSLVKRKLYGESGDGPSLGSTSWATTVSDAAVAEYIMSISLGTPPQNFVAVADTASDLTWLQCKPCESCFSQPSAVFDPELSSTFGNLGCSSQGCSSFIQQYGEVYVPACGFNGSSCEYVYVYGDMSNTTGTLSSETINLKTTSGESVTVPDFWFGCSHASFSTSALFDATDGLVGLGQGLISFPSQLGDVFDERFSYCLVNRSLAGVQSSPLVFGNDAAPDLALQYTPILCNEFYPYYYYIGLEGISVGGAAVAFNASDVGFDSFGNGGTIIDSGTTYTYLNSVAFDPLLTAVDSQFPSSYERVTLPMEYSAMELCYNVTGRPNFGDDLPDISLKLANDTSWDLAAENAWLLLPDIPDVGGFTICLSIMRGPDGAFSILGNTQQQDFYVLYDRVDRRIGFANTDCGSVS